MSQRRARGWLIVVAGLLLIGLVWFSWRDTERRPTETEATQPTAVTPAQRVGPAPADSKRMTAQASTDGGSAATPGEIVASFSWGSGEGALGRLRQQEGNPEGPMSLTVAPDGTLVLLDQVNGRLVRLDGAGRSRGSVPLPVQAAQDVVVAKDGTTLVLDRLVDKAVAVIGPDGAPRGELPLEGKGLKEGGASTGLFVDGDDVLVEREHGDLVTVGSVKGVASSARAEVPGRPSRDGRSLLTASLVDATQGLLALTAIDRSTLAHRFTRQLSFGQPVVALVLLDSDPSGLGYVGALSELPAPSIVVLCLDTADGQVTGRVQFPANAVADESFRELTVDGSGALVFLRRSEGGAQLERHRCQAY